MWKNTPFWVIFNDFLDLGSSDMTPYGTPNALWMIILSLGNIHCVCSNDKFDSMYWWYGYYYANNVLKMAHISPQGPQNIFFLIHCLIGGRNHMLHAMIIPDIHGFSMLVKMWHRPFVWCIFIFLSRFPIPSNTGIYRAWRFC